MLAVYMLPMSGWHWKMSQYYTCRSEGCLIGVVKASEIVASQPEERGEFDPLESKVYRHPTFYTIPDGIEHM